MKKLNDVIHKYDKFFSVIIILAIAAILFGSSFYNMHLKSLQENTAPQELDAVSVIAEYEKTTTVNNFINSQISKDNDEAEPMKLSEEPIVEKTEGFVENVPYISQLNDYPTGCESVSAVMALNYLGIDITVDDFIDDYLPIGPAPYYYNGVKYGADPWKEFPGDPKTMWGYGCFAPVIVSAVSSMPQNINAAKFYGVSLDDLCHNYIDEEIPVILWVTMGMDQAYVSDSWYTSDGSYIEWVSPMHCTLLIGYDEENYYFNDPTNGENKAYSKEEVEIAYNAMGNQAVVLTLN